MGAFTPIQISNASQFLHKRALVAAATSLPESYTNRQVFRAWIVIFMVQLVETCLLQICSLSLVVNF